VYVKDEGILINEPTYVAINVKTDEVEHIGEKAKEIMDYILSIKDAIVIVITHDQNPEILEEFDQIIVL